MADSTMNYPEGALRDKIEQLVGKLTLENEVLKRDCRTASECRKEKEADLKDKIEAICLEFPRYGY